MLCQCKRIQGIIRSMMGIISHVPQPNGAVEWNFTQNNVYDDNTRILKFVHRNITIDNHNKSKTAFEDAEYCLYLL